MKQPASTRQTFSPSDKTKIALVSIFLATLLFTFGFLLGLVLRQNGFRLSMLAPDLAGEEINTFNTPGASETKAEVRLLDMTALEDGNTISIGVSIHNYGGAAFTLSANNVLLTQPNGRPLALLRIEPRLPKKIQPGATKTFDFTFRRPASQTASLKIFTFEYDIEMRAISSVAPTSIIPPTSVAPTILAPTVSAREVLAPTPDCGSPTLLLGTTTFEIQNLAPAADGSLAVPPDTSGIAYWVEGTDTHPVFVLSPSPQNLAVMQTVSVGSSAKATRSDCSSTTYSLSAPQQSSLDAAASADQSVDGITIFFQTDSAGNGFVFTGESPEEAVSVINTPQPDESGVLAEISLLETLASPDGTTINVGVSIHNYGEAAFTLSGSDVSLTQPDGKPLALLTIKPRLPEEIKPGGTKTFDFTFRRPASETATLKIFTVEYDIEGY